MGFKISISKKAQSEIDNAVDYYAEINPKLALKFYNTLTDTFSKLEINPFYQIKIKNFRAINIYKFPFILFYNIQEEKNTIKILACFHTSQSTKKYPK